MASTSQYYENGNKKEDGFYKNDKRDSVWNSWYSNGKLKVEEYYKDGKLENAWKE